MAEPPPDWQELIAAARQASQQAYCPYSEFPVGAALGCGSGRIVSGCNVENASFGLTMCAERSAVSAAVVAGEGTADRLVVYTPTGSPTSPCGACRQVLKEFAPNAEVLCICDADAVLQATVAELLPFGFGAEKLASQDGRDQREGTEDGGIPNR